MLKTRNHKVFVILGLLLTVFFIAVINSNPGTIISGFDNASPYFSIDLFRKFEGSSLFIYGGLAPVLLFVSGLKVLGISASLISHLWLFGNIALGLVGLYLLIDRFLGNVSGLRDSRRILFATLGGVTFFLTSLFTMWIISQPNVLFLASYGSIPWLIYLLSHDHRNRSLLFYVGLICFTLLFYVTSLNIVAFFTYLFQIVLIASLLKSIIEDKPISQSLKYSVIWAIVCIIGWFLVLQLFLVLNGETTIVFANLYSYIVDLSQNPYLSQITQDIILSEKGNSFIDVFRYAVGWMELHDMNGRTIFSFYHLYTQNVIIMTLGLIPFALVLWSLSVLRVIWTRRTRKIYRRRSLQFLYLLLLVTAFAMTGVSVSIISQVPVVSTMFRWVSTKLWPSLMIPLVSTASYGLVMFPLGVSSNNSRRAAWVQIAVVSAVMLAFIIYAFPLFTGRIFSSHVPVNIPPEYFEIQDYVSMDRDPQILVLPSPQKLYFRQYEWGYYGSDFLTYLVEGDIIDGTNIYEKSKEYEDILSLMIRCSPMWKSCVDYVLYDESAIDADNPETGGIEPCVLEDLRVIKKLGSITLYRVLK